jgi:hypothetical protein
MLANAISGQTPTGSPHGMEDDEPDLKSENLADTDESPLGDTTEHAGEQDADQGETYHDPEGDGEGAPQLERRPGGEDGSESASPGEAEGGERVPEPQSEKLADRE